MKKVFALLLAVIMMAGLLAGCGKSGEETPSTAPSTEPTTAPSYEGPVDDDNVDYTIELPLVEDPYEFDYWVSCITFEDFASYADNLFFQWMEAQTGVHINFIHPPAGGDNEAFQTMVLSNDYPDFVQNVYSYYSGGMDKAIADGFLLRLNEYVDQWMPNYRSVVYRDETTFVQAITDSGNLWGVHEILYREQVAVDGLGVRADWLDKAGLTTADCETIEGLGNVLTQFKEYTYENCGPLYLSGGGLNSAGCLNAAYGVVSPTWSSNGFINKDGVATYSPLEPGMKAYIGQIAEWYAQGLVNRNYIADASFATPEDRWGNGEVGVGQFCYVNDKSFAAAAANSAVNPDPNFRLAAIATPKLNASDDLATDIHINTATCVVYPNFSLGITSACSDIELACKWLDYQWTEEGIHACNWGPYEGEEGDAEATYYVDPTDANGDGHQECYQPWLLAKYPSIFLVQMKVGRHIAPNYTIWSREWSALDQYQIEYTSIWDQAGRDWVWSSAVTLTADEGAEASSILTNCNTAFNEWAAQVITGEKSVDTYDTELVPMIEGMNAARAVEIYQAALERYQARSQYLD